MTMKKILFVTVLLFCVFILSSCDYPEKTFQALQRENIPKEVTRNFRLERGVYAPFVWTSDSDAIIISENEAIKNPNIVKENVIEMSDSLFARFFVILIKSQFLFKK